MKLYRGGVNTKLRLDEDLILYTTGCTPIEENMTLLGSRPNKNHPICEICRNQRRIKITFKIRDDIKMFEDAMKTAVKNQRII